MVPVCIESKHWMWNVRASGEFDEFNGYSEDNFWPPPMTNALLTMAYLQNLPSDTNGAVADPESPV